MRKAQGTSRHPGPLFARDARRGLGELDRLRRAREGVARDPRQEAGAVVGAAAVAEAAELVQLVERARLLAQRVEHAAPRAALPGLDAVLRGLALEVERQRSRRADRVAIGGGGRDTRGGLASAALLRR